MFFGTRVVVMSLFSVTIVDHLSIFDIWYSHSIIAPFVKSRSVNTSVEMAQTTNIWVLKTLPLRMRVGLSLKPFSGPIVCKIQ